MNKLITVGRQFGSGGRELGRRLADELGLLYCDNEIITEIAKQTNLSEGYVNLVLEQKPGHLYPITTGHSFYNIINPVPDQAQSVYAAQEKIIRDTASGGGCVIVGRCADFILRDMDPLRIFVYADAESRVRRCLERVDRDEAKLSEKEMLKKINAVDRNRRKYYEFYTGAEWGNPENYDILINTSGKDIKSLVPAVAKLVSD